MATALNYCHAGDYSFRTPVHLPRPMSVLPVLPLCIVGGNVDGTLELRCPLEMCSVEVRMAYNYRFQASLFVDEVHGRLIDESNQIPEYITMGCLQEDGPLAYAELFARCCAVAQAWRELGRCQGLGRDVVDAAVMFIRLELVLLCVLGGIERGPGLAMGRNVLTRVLVALVVGR